MRAELQLRTTRTVSDWQFEKFAFFGSEIRCWWYFTRTLIKLEIL